VRAESPTTCYVRRHETSIVSANDTRIFSTRSGNLKDVWTAISTYLRDGSLWFPDGRFLVLGWRGRHHPTLAWLQTSRWTSRDRSKSSKPEFSLSGLKPDNSNCACMWLMRAAGCCGTPTAMPSPHRPTNGRPYPFTSPPSILPPRTGTERDGIVM